MKFNMQNEWIRRCMPVFCIVTISGAMVNAAEYPLSPTRYWTNGVVPYVYSADFIEENKAPVEAAMAVWESAANITFVARTTEADYVKIQNAADGAGSNSPFIGKNGGEQPLNIRQEINTWSVTAYTFGLAHEWAHVLGYHHTHQRPDRNDYVTVWNNRITDCEIGNFTVASDSIGFPRNVMDYDSVMSYGQCIFARCNTNFDSDCECGEAGCTRWAPRDCDVESCCGDDLENCRTIEILDEADASTWQDALGQRDHLSVVDAMNMSFLYPQPNWRFAEKDSTVAGQTGSFLEPYVEFFEAEAASPEGTVLHLHPGTYGHSAGVYSKAMTIRGIFGGAVVR